MIFLAINFNPPLPRDAALYGSCREFPASFRARPPDANGAAKPRNGLRHIVGAADKADYPLDFDCALGRSLYRGLFFCCHYSPAAFSAFFSRPVISSTVLVRVSATCAASFKPSSAENVAFTTLCGFDVPSDLVSTL